MLFLVRRERGKEGKRERRKEGKKERRKEGKKERRKEERRKEGKTLSCSLTRAVSSFQPFPARTMDLSICFIFFCFVFLFFFCFFFVFFCLFLFVCLNKKKREKRILSGERVTS